MNSFVLAVFGAVLGLVVTLAAGLLAWAYLKRPRAGADKSGDGADEGETKSAAVILMRWNVFDYAVLALFIVGSVFLFTDIVAVVRDRESFPLYHYGYLISGFCFTFLGMLFMMVRLGVVLSVTRSMAGSGRMLAPGEHYEPSHAEHAE